MPRGVAAAGAPPAGHMEIEMKEQGLEKKVDESVARFETWYASLPLAVRLLGDIVCLGLVVYVVAMVASAIGLFGLPSPNTWALSTWGSVMAVCVFVGFIYELSVNSKKPSRK